MLTVIKNLIGITPEENFFTPVRPERHIEDVEIAAGWLDDEYPDWAKKLNLRTLNMESRTNCVLAQASGLGWSAAKDRHYWTVAREPWFGRAFGYPAGGDWKGLRKAWNEHIKVRRRRRATVGV